MKSFCGKKVQGKANIYFLFIANLSTMCFIRKCFTALATSTTCNFIAFFYGEISDILSTLHNAPRRGEREFNTRIHQDKISI